MSGAQIRNMKTGEIGLTIGTPKTLDEAIAQAIEKTKIDGRIGKYEENMYWAVKDFAAQRIGACILELQVQGHEAAADILMRHYNGFIRREE